MTTTPRPSYFRTDVRIALENIEKAGAILERACEDFERNPPYPILDVRLHERVETSIVTLKRVHKGLSNALAAVPQGDSP